MVFIFCKGVSVVLVRWLALLLFWMAYLVSANANASASPAVAFYYAADPPWNELQAFDIVVVDPDHVPDPTLPRLPHTRLAAYVSVGEVQASRDYAKYMQKDWLVAENPVWGGRLIDQSRPDWPGFFADSVIAPLWGKGYRTFFLDTLDAYQLFAKTPEEKARQEAGLVAVVAEVKRRFPEAQLIFNRGFEILDRTHSQVMAVAAESLFQGYDSGKKAYRPVAENDRTWLLGQLKRVHDEFALPIIAIDYVPPQQRELARATARQIESLGFIPWVATPDLTSLGVGLVEVMPRRILFIHSPLANEYELRMNPVVRMATMPLNFLGYAAEYADPHHLPEQQLSGLYAGVIVWMGERGAPDETKKLVDWLDKRVRENVPIVFVNQLSMLLGTPLGKSLGLETQPVPADMSPIKIIQQDALVGFERQPYPDPDEFMALSVSPGRPLLTLSKGKLKQVAAAITPWGGYSTFSSALATLPNDTESRWVIDPFNFFREALRLPDMPVPDVTTESGRRILLVHMDGDGFVSRSELPGNPYAGEAVRDRIVRKYHLPMAISVIEAELSPTGLFPKLSSRMENVARDIFRSPNVEIASHTYSHPFNWRKAEASVDDDSSENYNLSIPGYRFDLQREIEGSIHYIESRLAPPGKKVSLFLWSGDCIPGRDALEWTQRLGVLNMNGGDTVATRSLPTLTEVEGLGVERQGLFQVFAPNQNENVYTNGWTGPYYGYERVIETFQFTEKPRRLKPMDIYFHTFLTTKAAGMKSLDKVFSYALAQENTPQFASAYAAKVIEFPHIAVARSANGWRIRGMDNLHTLRTPASLGVPDLDKSRSVAGYNQHNGETYLHLVGNSADISFDGGTAAEPRLVSANARIEASQRIGKTLRWQLDGQAGLEFTLANVGRCRVHANGRDIVPLRHVGELFFYRLITHAARPLEAIC